MIKNEVMLNELLSTLLKRRNKKLLVKFLTKYFVCVIKTNNDIEKRILYLFWKRIGIRIKYEEEYTQGEWAIGDLVDIWFKQSNYMDSPIVDYAGWHIGIANIRRKEQAISFCQFKKIVLSNDMLHPMFNDIEKAILERLSTDSSI